MTDSFVHTNTFDAPVETVYATIADSAAHGAMTGAPADIGTSPGSAFTTHGGEIEGWMLDLSQNERIVQAWRPKDWAPGVYSVVRYDFASTEAGTQVTLTHSAIPEGAAEHLANGWSQQYWQPLAHHLAG